jgi:hypothetical protein
VHTPLWQSLAAEQVLPAAHLPHEAPPQSVSVSVPFLTRSVQLDAWHRPAVHTPLWQSPATLQTLPAAHLPHVPPPQSMSVSAPFLTLSVQVAARHLSGEPKHTPLWQSAGSAHVAPAPHLGHAPPPQSTSVSVPFLTTSAQLGAWQMLPMHTPAWQSDATLHILPAGHLPQVAPPQSMSVSVPFFTLSPHVGAWHLSGEPVHTPLWQSEPATQMPLVGHFGHAPPPQSTSVSVPFFTVSVQLDDWQMLPTHTPLWQSVPPLHTLPATHFGQPAPPQSTSVSVPFFTRSVQLTA